MPKAIYKCIIDGRPPVKKNTQRIVRNHGMTRAIYSPVFKAWEQTALLAMKSAHKDKILITAPLEARFKFYFKNRSGEADLSNLIEAPQDAMTKACVIQDDRLIQVIHATKHYGHEPRVEIELFELEGTT